MDCCQCQGIEQQFDQSTAEQATRDYQNGKISKSTHMLIEAIKSFRLERFALLDIGGGIGVIPHELMTAGVARAVSVEASSAYLDAAAREADRLGRTDQIAFLHGNFVDLAPEMEPVDVVTLDRVLCCYHDMAALVERSSALARQLYGVVYPRDTWWVKVLFVFLDLALRLRRSGFRVFIHPTASVETILAKKQFVKRIHKNTFFWQVAVFEKRRLARPGRTNAPD